MPGAAGGSMPTSGTPRSPDRTGSMGRRPEGIEPSLSRPQREVLPLNYGRHDASGSIATAARSDGDAAAWLHPTATRGMIRAAAIAAKIESASSPTPTPPFSGWC